jgi:hypothetical protein
MIDAQAAAEAADAIEMVLPPTVRVPRPAVVAAYLREHPDMVDIVNGLAAALAQEFKDEPAQIQLDVCVDDYVDERELIFNVRLANYGDSIIERLERASVPFDDQLSHASGWVVATTDFGQVE